MHHDMIENFFSLVLSSAEARVTNSNNYPSLFRVAKATNRQKNGSAEGSSSLARD